MDSPQFRLVPVELTTEMQLHAVQVCGVNRAIIPAAWRAALDAAPAPDMPALVERLQLRFAAYANSLPATSADAPFIRSHRMELAKAAIEEILGGGA